VTGLGEFSPIWRLFPLGSLLKEAKLFGYFFLQIKQCINFIKKRFGIYIILSQTLSVTLDPSQGGQIGRFFTYWAIVYFGQIVFNNRSSPNLLLHPKKTTVY
jgi:hypothetical protein